MLTILETSGEKKEIDNYSLAIDNDNCSGRQIYDLKASHIVSHCKLSPEPKGVKLSRNKKVLLIIAAVWVVGSYIVFTGLSSTGKTVSMVDKPAPDFSIGLYSGENVRLSDFIGKKSVVLNFWASWCPPCRDEAPAFSRVSTTYKDRVEFIGVVSNDSQKKAEAFMDEFDIDYENGQDMGNRISKKYNITGIPETFFIDIDGNITEHWIGPIDEQGLIDQTNNIL